VMPVACAGLVLRQPVWLTRRGMRAARIFLPVVLFSVCALARAEDIAPFTTDGCSDFPDGTTSQKTLWRDCCVMHDKAYWAGGTYAERLAADNELERCVAAAGEPVIGGIMRVGVRVGGAPYWPTPFRWGYGWPGIRGYQALTVEEREQASLRLAEYEATEATRTARADQLPNSASTPSR